MMHSVRRREEKIGHMKNLITFILCSLVLKFPLRLSIVTKSPVINVYTIQNKWHFFFHSQRASFVFPKLTFSYFRTRHLKDLTFYS